MALTTIKTGAIADDAVTTDKLANAINTERTANTAKDLTALSASNLTSGTVPDARFPATLPAASAANLTAVPAANITGTLPAISAANLTNIPAANITGTLPAISGANLTGISSAGKAHNLIVNGAMLVAQRGTSSTSSLYQTVDRFRFAYSGVDENPTNAQVDVASGTTPYTLGFRKSLKVINGNQTSGAGSADRVAFEYRIEAQDIANSGWNYVSASSNITLSFWAKSSVAQNFYFYFETVDGTAQIYTMETGALSANTWTKITKTIPGNSNLQFDNNNNIGLKLQFMYYTGTDYTDNSQSLNTWGAYNSASRSPDQTTTWYTTDDANFEMTGLQLEVGDSATDFEHRSYPVEERLCQRYYFRQSAEHQYTRYACHGQCPSANGAQMVYPLPVRMRANPTLGYSALSDFYIYASNLQAKTPTSLAMDAQSTISPMFNAVKSGTFSAGTMAHLTTPNAQQGYLEFIAEL